jgi:hypothetical protein
VVSRADGIAMGHLPKAHVRPTLEMVLTEPPRYLRKRKESERGFALIVALTKVDPQTVATGFRASKIVGSSVVNEANETVVTPTEKAPFAVGSFLGLGTKYVVAPFGSLHIQDKKVCCQVRPRTH